MPADDIRIRTASRGDLPAIDGLMSRAFPQLLKGDYPPSVLVTAIPLISRAQPALVTCGTYYVAEGTGGRILGSGGWTQRDPSTGQTAAGEGNIRHFATDPDATRRGIGRALLAQCLSEASAAGLTRMVCYATLTAQPFYAASGFQARQKVAIELRAGVRLPAVLMDLQLN